MTSQKRYRHHQDNNNGSTRFRDLPPRFKRQKSSTSPTPPQSKSQGNTSSSEGHKINQENKAIDTSPISLPESYCSASSAFEMGKERLGGRADFQPQLSQMATRASPTWQWQQGKESPAVLSQVDNRYNLSVNAQSPPPVIQLGNHFGYRANSPPQSPWNPVGVSQLPAQPCVFNPQHWGSMSNNSYLSPMLHSPTSVYNSENTAPNPRYAAQCNSNASWSKPTLPVQFQPNSASTTIPPQTSPSPPSLEVPVPNVNSERRRSSSAKGSVDYSDPDIRTIEMLRELERVADEKEADGDDFGVDRKSLVSHHLRMLMCAVDRYTEGVEDEGFSDSRDDEVMPPADSPLPSPVPSPLPTKMSGPVKENVPNNIVNSEVWGPKASISSMWKEPQQQKMPSSNRMNNTQSYQSSMASVPMPFYPTWAEQNGPQRSAAPAWDLWSSPSFDFSGFLSNQPMPENMFNVFRNSGDLSSENEDRERKPLYQR